MFNDKILRCKDCGRDFEFTASEQEFNAQKGFTNEPGRCPECRATKKAQTTQIISDSILERFDWDRVSTKTVGLYENYVRKKTKLYKT
ncbi:zinc-ribbon domain containing protein [Desulfosporosinus sp. BG]|uniref:zinc-ribbon domain containing protein n=1 Tax=Desulfosporosinus sp. BG TaxID=1633135 RepID=UPI00085813B8|nr:zinc-ribbon domain containing protein [Desulfosporosinus sp. BG]ODA40298.1 hypothetical protein DSBG_2897 [Desulfosporosinus sp. BG]